MTESTMTLPTKSALLHLDMEAIEAAGGHAELCEEVDGVVDLEVRAPDASTMAVVLRLIADQIHAG